MYQTTHRLRLNLSLENIISCISVTYTLRPGCFFLLIYGIFFSDLELADVCLGDEKKGEKKF